MNLTDEQKELLKQIVDVYLGGCRSPFIFNKTMTGTSLKYSGHPSVPVNADKTDVMRLAAEGYVDCTLTSRGDPRGKPSAAGIALVERSFADLPVFPLEPDSVSVSQFCYVLASDLNSEQEVQHLMAHLFFNPDVEVRYFIVADCPEGEFMKAALDRGDILKIKHEKFYYANPKAQRDFFHIPQARYGDYSFEWQRELVEKGPEYTRIWLRLSERKRLEMETMHRIQLEHLYREQMHHEKNAVNVFLSYASTDQNEADRIYTDLASSGATVFLAKKSLNAGEDFAERIRDTLKAAKEVWILLSPASLKSEWVLTEWGAAWALEKVIVPILHRCQPGGLPPRLARLHCVDLYGVPELVKQRFKSN